ncbi:MAG: TonB-dependent receptor [Gemmatimonadaceae bacterium]
MIFILIAPAGARAQATGSIVGTVTAAVTSRGLADVRVSVEGSVRVARTDGGGRYRLDGLAPGDYTVIATRVGRAAGTAHVKVAADGITRADFVLAEGSILLPGIVVSAARSSEMARAVAATVHVMSAADLRASPARTADDVVRQLPGLEQPRTSSTASGPEQIVSIRGADEGRTLVLLDNVPLNDPWGEWIQWNRAPRFQLDRVEVVEGGGSSLYGNYAMGGVIAMHSQPIVARGYQLLAAGGSRKLADFSAYGSDVAGRLGYSLSGEYGSGGGYTVLRPDQRGPLDQESGARRLNLRGRAEYMLGAGNSLFVDVNHFADDRTLGTPLTEPNQRSIDGAVLGADVATPGAGRLEARLYGQTQRYDSHSSVVNATRTSERPNVAQSIPSHDIGGSIQWSRRAGSRAHLAAGADFRQMVGRLDETVLAPDGSLAGTRTSGGSQWVGGAFLRGLVTPMDALRVEASVRIEGWRSYAGSRFESMPPTTSFTAYDEKTNSAFAPRLGVRYEILPSLAVRGSLFEAFRAPTLSEQYRTFFSGPNVFLGNPTLTPEYLTGWDAGLDWQPAARLEMRATVFDNQYRDLDDFVFLRRGPNAGGITLQRQNLGRARARGVEGEIALRATDELTVAASYNYDDARVAATGAAVNRVPLQRATARLTWALPALAGNVIYRYEGPNHALGGREMAPYAVVDLDLRREIARGIELFGSVQNLFDRQYTANWAGPLESIGLPRTVRVGIAARSF